MKSKGFTLIELLAVIVILAIIALIAVPIIINIINESRESSNKRSVEMYGKAVEQAIAKAQLTKEVPTGEYTSSNDGKTLTHTDSSTTPATVTTIDVQYSGNKVVCTTNTLYEDGKIYLAGCKVGTDTKEYRYGEEQQTLSIIGHRSTQLVTNSYESGWDPQTEESIYTEYTIGKLAT